MEFNPDKCEVLYFQRVNVKEKYTDNGRTLNSTGVQRDLGIEVHSFLKVATEIDRVVKKAYGMLVFIGRGSEYKSQDVMLQLYKTT
eukprot:g29601.t1